MTGFNFGAMLSQNNQIKQIPLDMLVPFHNHQFSLYDGERRDDMVESIRKNGVMTPIVCRPNPNGSDTYEILIGHNRWNCSKIAGLETIPAIIKEQLTEDEAQTYVDESNLIQRGFNDLKISEQARIIARRYSEMFSQGKRNDIINEIKMLNGENSAVTGNSREKVAEEYGLSRNTIARLVRISKLSDSILGWIDKGQLAVRAGVELSYLLAEEQEKLFEINSVDDNMLMKISEAQARDLRVLSADGVLDEDEMLKVLSAKKKKPTKKYLLIQHSTKNTLQGLAMMRLPTQLQQLLICFSRVKKKAITMTKAVLFQRNGQPVLFTDYAEYDTGTGYIVAENKEIGFCYICRILDKSEIFNYNKALPLVVKDKGLKEVSVMVVTDKYKSIADAEKHYPKLLGGNNYDD